MRILPKHPVVLFSLFFLNLHGASHWEGSAHKNVCGHVESVDSDIFTFLF